MKIALASPRPATSIEDGLARVDECLRASAAQGARIVCFPEAYLPGLRGQDFVVPDYDAQTQQQVLGEAARLASKHQLAMILGMEWIVETGRQIAAVVFDASGQMLGRQTKTQLDPSEDRFYQPGDSRRLFEVEGLKFGIAICHEGWRYPETVRWAAARGARVVFHPQHTGGARDGVVLSEWGDPRAPYYEKAMLCRSIENSIYFASVNYALPYPESATSVIGPAGELEAYLAYGQEGVLVHDLDLEAATGLLARRYAPERYRDASTDA